MESAHISDKSCEEGQYQALGNRAPGSREQGAGSSAGETAGVGFKTGIDAQPDIQQNL